MNWFAFAETNIAPPNYPPLWTNYKVDYIAITEVPTEAELLEAALTDEFWTGFGTLSPTNEHFVVVLSGKMTQV